MGWDPGRYFISEQSVDPDAGGHLETHWPNLTLEQSEHVSIKQLSLQDIF